MPHDTVEHLPDGAAPVRFWSLKYDTREQVDAGVIDESALSIYVNGQSLATLMCSPVDQAALTLGFLFNEGVITRREDVRWIHFNTVKTAVDVFLRAAEFSPPRRIVLTSGCSGGITFQDIQTTLPALESDFATTPDNVIARMRDLHTAAQLFATVRGVHTALLATPDRALLSAEDVGRHNTVDKLAGQALQAEIATQDRILLTTGRISSEMLNKARQMGVPLIASRTSPTSVTLKLAQAWNICVVGYLRGSGMRVYTHPQRLGLPPL